MIMENNENSDSPSNNLEQDSQSNVVDMMLGKNDQKVIQKGLEYCIRLNNLNDINGNKVEPKIREVQVKDPPLIENRQGHKKCI